MTDIDIIRLLWIRDEIAIEELEINYGHYCRQISWEIVQNREDEWISGKTDKNRSNDFRASILVYGDTTGNCKAYGFKGKKCL